YLGWAEFYHGQRVYTPKGSGGGTTPVPSHKYPNVEVGTGASELKSGWYQLLGALGYKGATWTRVQSWLKASGDYTGRIDNDFGPLSVAALQRRLRNAYRKDNSGKLLDPGPADGLRGAKTRQAEAAYPNTHRWRAKSADMTKPLVMVNHQGLCCISLPLRDRPGRRASTPVRRSAPHEPRGRRGCLRRPRERTRCLATQRSGISPPAPPPGR